MPHPEPSNPNFDLSKDSFNNTNPINNNNSFGNNSFSFDVLKDHELNLSTVMVTEKQPMPMLPGEDSKENLLVCQEINFGQCGLANSKISKEKSKVESGGIADEKGIITLAVREYVKTLYVFNPERAGDLGLSKGDTVVVMKKNLNGWWLGHNQNTNKTGHFPSNFVTNNQN